MTSDEHQFMEEERESLKVHVQACARRHGELREDMKNVKSGLTQIRNLLIGMIVTMVVGGYVTVEKALPMISAAVAAGAAR